MEVNRPQLAILDKLFGLNSWGKNHTDIDDLVKGFPSHVRKDLKKECRKLMREGLIIKKMDRGRLHVYLNLKRREDIYRMLEVPKRD